ncbi:MAG: hypothetical protein QM640_14690 [Niabella sp.]
MIGLKFVIILGVLALMVIGSIYTYRFLNNKLQSSSGTIGLLLYALSLFITIGSIYAGGIFAMAWIYHYLVN